MNKLQKLIINADDFGYSEGVNAGIIHSHLNGVLTSTTLMANSKGTTQGIELSKEIPSLGVGAHLVATFGKPIKRSRSTLTDSEGNFYKLDVYKEKMDLLSQDELFEEWSEQIDYLQENGVNLTHFDSHHHVHSFPCNIEVTKEISKKYNLPYRNCHGIEEGQDKSETYLTDYCVDLMNFPAIRSLEVIYLLKKEECYEELYPTLDVLKNQERSEIMVHPAFVDDYLYHHSSFNLMRMREVDILTDGDFKQLLNEYGFELCNYATI